MNLQIQLQDQNHPDRRTLAAALRARPTSVHALAQLLDGLPADRFDEALATLTQAGFISQRGDTLDVAAPDLAIVQAVQAELAHQSASSARISQLLDALPALLRDWELGQPGDDHPLRAEVVHGQLEVWDAWWRFAAGDSPRSPCCVIPDPAVLLDVIGPDLVRVSEFMGPDIGMRVLVPVEFLQNRPAMEVLARMMQIGFEVRMLSMLPGWFYVDPGVVASMPITWGEAQPSNMLLVRNDTVTGALAALFDQLWMRAEPIVGQEDGWAPVLTLLAQGMPDETIARILGLSVRTVRRRIAEAMEELNAPSRFTLGVEWAKRGQSGELLAGGHSGG